MDANELMIGDWVEPRQSMIPTVYCQVEGIYPDGTVHLDKAERLFTLDELTPVHIIPEILEKNGFVKDNYKDDRLTDVYHLLVPTGFERNSFTIQVSLYREPMCGVSTLVKCWGWLPPYNGGLNDIHLCSANYVHQLQHALRLCGIEKEIIL